VFWNINKIYATVIMHECRIEYDVKKDRFYTSGGTRVLRFVGGAIGDIAQLKASGKTLTISIGPGLAKNASEF